jgi:hypothetical protein
MEFFFLCVCAGRALRKSNNRMAIRYEGARSCILRFKNKTTTTTNNHVYVLFLKGVMSNCF